MHRPPITLLLLLAGSIARAAGPLTVEAAVAEALVANAELPIADDEAAVASAAVDEARGERGPTLGIEADLHGGYPFTYASGDGLLQVVAAAPLFDPGAGPNVRSTSARSDSARFRALATRADVEEAVRGAFAQVEALEEALDLAEKGVAALEAWQTLVAARRAAGEPVAGDVLQARARRAQVGADLAAARRELVAARIELNDLLGRDPTAPLELVHEPPPVLPAAPGEIAAPDLLAAASDVSAATAEVEVARSARRPRVDVSANVGSEPVIGPSFDAPLNTGRGVGAEAILSASWPLLDHGVTRARVAQSTAMAHEAEQVRVVTERAVEREHAIAWADVRGLADEAGHLRELVPVARDAWLYQEAEYRGGAGSALEVLDAYDTWTESAQREIEATLACRLALAHLRRWEEP